MKRLITLEIDFDPNTDRMSSIAEELMTELARNLYLSSFIVGLRYAEQGMTVRGSME